MRLLPVDRRGFLALSAALAMPGNTRARPRGTQDLPGDFVAIAYHEIGPDAPERFYSISESQLVQHLSFLRDDGWTAVTLDQLLAARDGRRALPGKAVLLTFDDGYLDYYTRVFPLLLAFRMPALFALVTSWLEVPQEGSFDFGGLPQPRSSLMRWPQIREMAGSGLCEFASHSHDMHRGVAGNPQGNQQPAAITRIFDAARGTYETDAAYLRRIEQDLQRSSAIIRRETGRSPRSVVWPYGRYNGASISAARRLGMPIAISLDPRPGRLGQLDNIGRLLTMGDPGVPELARLLRFEPDPERVLHVDLDYIHDADPRQQERNLDALVERIAQLRPTHVYLQAFADPDANGVAEAVYFPNRHLPMRADLFNRVSWQIATRSAATVYAWMPVLAFNLGAQEDLVLSVSRAGSSPAPAADAYRRLSPFSARARRWIGEIYEDLARHAPFSGILFHDDAFLSDYEDANPSALAAYRAAGLPGDIDAIRRDPAAMARWTSLKTQALIDLTLELRQRAERWRAPLATARNIFARPVLDPAAEAWFAQSLPSYLAAYDRTAIMAMPMMENAPDADAFLRQLVARVKAEPDGVARTVFELQALDWRSQPARPVPDAVLRDQLRLLQRLGIRNMGWYPDDFIRGQPSADAMMDVISARSFPFRRR